VLAAPPAQGFGLVAWLLPVGGFIAVGVVVAIALRRWKREHEREATLLGPGRRDPVRLEPDVLRRLERELADFDG
jgi:cytochrome c-type biogenesis protein CcmH/NrfF